MVLACVETATFASSSIRFVGTSCQRLFHPIWQATLLELFPSELLACCAQRKQGWDVWFSKSTAHITGESCLVMMVDPS